MAGKIADHRSAVKRCRLQICTSGFEPYFAYPEEPGYPAIENHGGTVVGNNGAAQGYPAGTKIPPTKVDIIRPEDLRK